MGEGAGGHAESARSGERALCGAPRRCVQVDMLPAGLQHAGLHGAVLGGASSSRQSWAEQTGEAWAEPGSGLP